MRSDTFLSVLLAGISFAARDALLFEFTSLTGNLPAATAGAHIDVHLPIGPRQYSLVTPRCTARSYVIAVKREIGGRGGSLWLHEEARVGSTFQISRPRNNFSLNEDAETTLLLAGGIGITPIYSMFEHLKKRGRAVQLHYWSRSPEHVLFLDHLKDQHNTSLYFSSDDSRTPLAAVLKEAEPRSTIYCCGPSRMLDECTASLPDKSRLHVERFVSTASTPSGDVTAFTVHLARSGRDIMVAPGETILGALLAAGIDVPYSCEEGICGACESRLLDGSPVHRDTVRSAEDHAKHGTIMICCSLSRGPRLVLDI